MGQILVQIDYIIRFWEKICFNRFLEFFEEADAQLAAVKDDKIVGKWRKVRYIEIQSLNQFSEVSKRNLKSYFYFKMKF